MFNVNQDNKIMPNEFEQLWNYLIQWREIFNKFDRDKNKVIDSKELATALNMLGYDFGPFMIKLAVNKYDPENTGVLQFDDFVRLCCVLNSLKGQFNSVDTGTGVININFEKFVSLIFSSAV